MITTFPSHAKVRCLKCDTDLSPQNEFGQLKMLQIGTWAKKCPKCQLVTSYDVDAAPVTPREAAEWEFEEPDWPQAFEQEQQRWPDIPKHLREELAFEEVLKRWRKWHWTPDGDKKMPAGAIEAMIALAKLGVMPPRSAYDPVERDGVTGYQSDDHCWMLSTEGELWRVRGVEDRTLHLEQNFDGSVKAMQVDLNKMKWDRYIETATAMLQAMT